MSMTPQQAREQLDAHVREIVNWHFDPQNGTPFWLEKAKELASIRARTFAASTT